LTVSFQIIIVFVNNAKVSEDKNHAVIYKMAIKKRLPFTDRIAEWNVLKSTLRISNNSTYFQI